MKAAEPGDSPREQANIHSEVSFARPPVDEVVFGIRFEPFSSFKLPHFGLLWNKFKGDYPTIGHVAALPSGETLVVDAATTSPLPRVWFVSETDDELVQFQVDLLYFNWRRRQKEYPRFKNIFPKFLAAKSILDSIVSELSLDPIVTLEHELTYINHIPQGAGWNSLKDLPNLFPIFGSDWCNFQLLPEPTRLAWRTRFDLPDSIGRLDVQFGQARRKSDQHPLLTMQLTVKGKPPTADWTASQAWFQTAHTWIVNGFVELTSKQSQTNIWERTE